MPHTDEDWAKVQNAALTLAEATNLVKMPTRRVAPPGDKNNVGVAEGEPHPELSPEEIQAKIDANGAKFNKFADALRDKAIEALNVTKAKKGEALFQIGSDLDQVCENCHLEYWYPNQNKPAKTYPYPVLTGARVAPTL